jgi:chemotaxis protein methyltransferase CheR
MACCDIGRRELIVGQCVVSGSTATSRQAESIGLIVTELVMNALKHAFPDEKVVGEISVRYDRAGTNWKLTISDNGIGRPDGIFAQQKVGLGTGIIKALSHQLNAQVETLPAAGVQACRSPTPLSRRRQLPR